MRDVGRFDDPRPFQLDVFGTQVVEQAPATTDQYRCDVNMHFVEKAWL